MDTTRSYPRTLDQAFPDRTWGDPAVMAAMLDKPAKPSMDFRPAWYVQAAEAATEVGADDSSLPEGAAISFLAAVALVCVAAGLVVLLTIYA